MNQSINSPTVITEKTGWTVFLAGPMKASPRGWRNKLVKAATKKVILGIDSEICGTRHMKFLAKRYGVKVHTSMEGCLANKHNLK